jgi:hypothetical protein
MIISRTFIIGLLHLGGVVSQTCPEIPDTGVIIGEPVPIRPEDIPPGCSDYEILVGKKPFPYTAIMVDTRV